MKKILVSFTVAASLLMVGGCKKDYLETAPTDKVDNSAIFQSVENANVALNGIYRYMFERTTAVSSNQQNKPGMGGILLGLDFMGEDIGISSANWFTSTGEGNWRGHTIDNSVNTLYYYRTLYRIIGNANYIIDYVDDLTGSDADKAMVKSQALTLRAYAYSYLVQFYGKRYDAGNKPNTQLGVPLLLSSTDTKMPRVSVEEVYKAINDDLDAAIALDVASRQNKSQANVWVAKALKARVALTMQDYPTAIQYAKEVIDSGMFPLMSQDDYQAGFNNGTIGEIIWASMPTADQGDTFGSYFAQIAYDANTSFQRANPKRINSALYDLISDTDVRKKMWEAEPTVENFPLPSTAFARQPYMSRKFAVKEAGGTLGDVTLMRGAEMHLILAEAYASSSQEGLAQDALFVLVSARDNDAVKSNQTGNSLLEEIWTNRRVELWGEGFRFLDLKRLNQPLDRDAVPNYVSTSVAGLMYVPAGDNTWQFLIPRSEMENNANIGEQNP